MASCAEKLNFISAWWFWLTITGVFYCGLGHVLPALYAGYSQEFFWFQHILCYFLFAQMIVNWACVRYVGSPFRPEDHMNLRDANGEIMEGGFEINLNHLKSNPDTGTYSIPVSSVYSCNGTVMKPPKTTLYLVAVPTPEEEARGRGGEGPETSRSLVYPYWSWKPCFVCQCQRPPRAHHCPLCKMCVLKRDHHCFFTGSCIGLRNQRHFVVFNFWAGIATTYCLVHSVVYLLFEFLPRSSYWDLLLPITFPRWLLGYTTLLDFLMVGLLYSLSWFCITSIGFFAEQVRVIRKGMTTFEEDNKIKITNTNSVQDNLKGVFGDYWYLNLLMPLHFKFPNTDTGVMWPNVKV